MIQWLALMWAWNRSPSPVMGKSRDNPRYYRRAQRQLRRKQRHVSRCTKRFSGWRKAGRFIAKLLDKAESADRVLVKVERNLATMPWWKACSEETLESAPSVFAWSKYNPRPRLGIGNSTARTAPKNRNACHSGRGS